MKFLQWFAMALMLWVGGVGSRACAQNAISSWAGEWGRFEQAPSKNLRQFEGHGLSIYDCSEQRCGFSINVWNKASHGDAKGFVQLESDTDAVAHLLAERKEYCSLRLTMDQESPSIVVRAGDGDCSPFETRGATFAGSYPLHTRDRYYGSDMAGCFAATQPAQLAICTSKDLVARQSKWELLFLSVAELGSSSGVDEIKQEETAEDALLQACERAAQVADCLATAFAKSTDELNARKAAWLDGVTAPGDVWKASQAAGAIAGSYRHSFPNGDVQGDEFLSTDTLQVTALANGAIRYAVRLEFYNGHECSLEGTASYKRVGFFVDQRKTGQPDFPLCVFEIRPTPKGVEFQDPTSACKMMSCGERGGYNGAGFSFKDRR